MEIPDTIIINKNYERHERKTSTYIDSCIIPEVRWLWDKGIRTTGCCCGHNIEDLSYIGVVEEDIPKMIDIGYKIRKNPFDSSRQDSFIPKSV